MIIFFGWRTFIGYINVSVDDCVSKFAKFKISFLSYDLCKDRICGKIKRYTESYIPWTLWKMAIQFAVGNVECKSIMTRRKFAFNCVPRFPCCNNKSAAVWISFYFVYHVLDLIYFGYYPFTVFIFFGAREMSPVMTISSFQITVFISPGIPYFCILS